MLPGIPLANSKPDNPFLYASFEILDSKTPEPTLTLLPSRNSISLNSGFTTIPLIPPVFY